MPQARKQPRTGSLRKEVRDFKPYHCRERSPWSDRHSFPGHGARTSLDGYIGRTGIRAGQGKPSASGLDPRSHPLPDGDHHTKDTLSGLRTPRPIAVSGRFPETGNLLILPEPQGSTGPETSYNGTWFTGWALRHIFRVSAIRTTQIT